MLSPESRYTGLARKDSLNPTNTCHGITKQGKACRKKINLESSQTPYCHLHKNQKNNQKNITNRNYSNYSTSTSYKNNKNSSYKNYSNTNKKSKNSFRNILKRFFSFLFCTSTHHNQKQNQKPASKFQNKSNTQIKNNNNQIQKQTLNLTISPQCQKILQTELKTPISSADQIGYIYIYCLSTSLPSLQSYLKNGNNNNNNKTFIWLKIGRTINVHKRIGDWESQCGTKLSLVYHSMPCISSHRAEKLIHIILADAFGKSKFTCPNCNHIHREWFVIPIQYFACVQTVIQKWTTYLGIKDI